MTYKSMTLDDLEGGHISETERDKAKVTINLNH